MSEIKQSKNRLKLRRVADEERHIQVPLKSLLSMVGEQTDRLREAMDTITETMDSFNIKVDLYHRSMARLENRIAMLDRKIERLYLAKTELALTKEIENDLERSCVPWAPKILHDFIVRCDTKGSTTPILTTPSLDSAVFIGLDCNAAALTRAIPPVADARLDAAHVRRPGAATTEEGGEEE